jgi:hypothetical protein
MGAGEEVEIVYEAGRFAKCCADEYRRIDINDIPLWY